MRIASGSPHPYLLDEAGGTCPVKQFSLIGNQLRIVPSAEKPMTGGYHLVYRCPEHETYDIKRAVHSDGTHWSVVGQLPADEDFDVCYPGPSSSQSGAEAL